MKEMQQVRRLCRQAPQSKKQLIKELFRKPQPDKEALVLKPHFKFILRKKDTVYISYGAFFSCLNLKLRHSKLLCTL